MAESSSSGSEDGENLSVPRADITESESGEDVRISAYSEAFQVNRSSSKQSLTAEQGTQDRWSLFAKAINDSSQGSEGVRDSESNGSGNEDSGSVSGDDEASILDSNSGKNHPEDASISADGSDSDGIANVTADFTASDAEDECQNTPAAPASERRNTLDGSWADWMQATPGAPRGAAESDAYFSSRAWQSRLGAWASEQSKPLIRRADLERKVDEYAARFRVPSPVRSAEDAPDPGVPIPRPPHWGGYHLWPESVELWHEGAARLHERARWSRELVRQGDSFRAGGWTATRLQP